MASINSFIKDGMVLDCFDNILGPDYVDSIDFITAIGRFTNLEEYCKLIDSWYCNPASEMSDNAWLK